jgi:hypothetical protein
MGLDFFPKACYTGWHFSSFPSEPKRGFVKEADINSVLKTFITVLVFSIPYPCNAQAISLQFWTGP